MWIKGIIFFFRWSCQHVWRWATAKARNACGVNRFRTKYKIRWQQFRIMQMICVFSLASSVTHCLLGIHSSFRAAVLPKVFFLSSALTMRNEEKAKLEKKVNAAAVRAQVELIKRNERKNGKFNFCETAKIHSNECWTEKRTRTIVVNSTVPKFGTRFFSRFFFLWCFSFVRSS